MKRKHIIFLLLICLGVIFTSTVHGDNYGISSYEQLMEYLNSPQSAFMAVLTPSDDFGWPETNQTIKITKEFILSKPWVIPKNIKLLFKEGGNIDNRAGSGYNYIRIKGKVEFDTDYSYFADLPAMTVMKGGQLIIDDNDHWMPNTREIIVKNGGILVLKGNLKLKKYNEDEKGLLNLEKGAIVKPSGKGRITLDGGCLKGNNVNTKSQVVIQCSNEESSYKNSISGTISMKQLYGVRGFKDPSVTIDKNAKVTITDTNTLGVMQQNDYNFTVSLSQNARLMFNTKNSVQIRSMTLNLAKGSAITAPNSIVFWKVTGSIAGTVKTPGLVAVTDGSKLTIKNGGLIISTNDIVSIEDKSVLTISKGGILRVKNKKVNVNNASVKGNGSIYIGKKGEVTDPKKGIASTIKIVKK